MLSWMSLSLVPVGYAFYLLYHPPVGAFLSLVLRLDPGNAPGGFLGFLVVCIGIAFYGMVFLSTRFVAGLVSLAVLVILFGLIVHRAIWPLLSRITYPLQRFGIFEHRKLIAALGVTLFLGLPIKDFVMQQLGLKASAPPSNQELSHQLGAVPTFPRR